MSKFIYFVFILSSFTTMAQELKKITYTDGTSEHIAEAIIQKKGLPGVLILPAWMGIDEEARTAAKELAQKGYNVLIADIYGTFDTPSSMEAAKKISGFYKEHPDAFQHKIRLALEQLVSLGAIAEKTAVIGYCFGGTGAVEAARGNLPFTGVVSIHGGLKKADKTYSEIRPKVLIVNPSEDESVSKQDIDSFMDEMRKGHADWQFIYYADSKHTFTNPSSKDYNPVMAQRAWNHTVMFLEEVLK